MQSAMGTEFLQMNRKRKGKWARAVSQDAELVALLAYDSATQEWQPGKVLFQ